MNRRDLIRRGPLALLGLVGVAAGVKAQSHDTPQRIIVPLQPDSDAYIVRVVEHDIRVCGRIREAIFEASNARLK